MHNIIICDNDDKTRGELKKIVIEFLKENNFRNFNISSLGNYSDTIKCVHKNKNKKNIYILDIELNENKNGLMLGIDIRKIDKYSGIMIYITSHIELSQKVFEYKLQALEFIDKKTCTSIKLKQCLKVATKIILSNEQDKKEELEIKFGAQIFKVPTQDILYIETIKNSRKLVLYTDKDRIEFYSSLRELKNTLFDNFIQVHKTTLVNKNHIRRVNKGKNDLYVELTNGLRCTLSRSGLKEVIDI